MEPATLYVSILLAVFGLWVLGDRVWVVGNALVARSASMHIARRVAPFIVACAVGITLMRLGSASALTVPVHERVIVATEVDPTATPTAGLLSPDRAARVSPEAQSGTYTVVAGDCLWRIARQTLEADGLSPNGLMVDGLWRVIYELNRDLIGDDPNLIHPGQVLVLPAR